MYQAKKTLIMDTFSSDRKQHLMIDVIITSLNIPFEKPLCSCPGVGDFSKSGITSSFRSKPVRVERKQRFIECFQDLAHDLLQQFIRPGGHIHSPLPPLPSLTDTFFTIK